MNTNFCHLCETCGFESKEEYQEIHVTVSGSFKQLELFKTLCALYGGKSITIDLANSKQTMSSISFKGSRSDAKELSDKLSKRASKCGLLVQRVKLESSIFGEVSLTNSGYFEGHIAVNTNDHKELEKQSSNFHVSRNFFKPNILMMTLREKKHDVYTRIMDEKVKQLTAEGISVSKVIREYCWYDSNINLDKEWVEKNEN